MRVKVYTKDYELLAVFSPSEPSDEYASQNMMIEPRVSIESNGSSTFTFRINSNSEKWEAIRNPENIYLVDGREYTAINENSYQYNGDEITVSLVETWYLLSRKYVQAYNVPKEDEFIDDQSVVLLPKSTEPLIVNGVQYDDVPYPRGSAGYNLWALLQGSGWKLGTCDVIADGFDPAEDYGVFNLETDMKDLLYNIQQVQKLYGGILDWDSVNKTLNLRDPDKWDTDYGFEVRRGKNLKSPLVIDQNNDIITRVFPLGESNLNIAAVNENKRYVENFSWTTEVYERNIQNSDLYDQKQLKYWGELQLEKLCKPTTSITAEIVDRRFEPGFEHEVFDINDIATIRYTDAEGHPSMEKQRIISWDYNVFAPYDANITMGDRRKDVIELFHQVFETSEKTDNTINSNGHISWENIWSSSQQNNLPGIIKNQDIHIENVRGELSTKIDITAEGIRTEVSNMEKELTSKIEQTAGEIRTEVSDAVNGLQSTISQTASEIRAEVSTVDGKVGSLSLRVDDNEDSIFEINTDITSINSDIVDINGEIRALSADFNSLSSDVATIERAYITEADVDRIIANTIKGDYFEGKNIYCNGLFSGTVSTDAFASDSATIGGERLNYSYISVPSGGSANLTTGKLTFNYTREYCWR